jgi:hypothetical protein
MTASQRQMTTPAASPVREGALLASHIGAGVRKNLALLLVLLAFAGSAVIVPTLAPVATTDDWAYARSAQILLEERRLTVFPVVAATAVFQIVWGALFGLLFGPTLGVFRLSTVVIAALGALALYGLCHDLGVSRGRGALGVAAYLFNPLVFVLAFTFMTDAHFVALMVVATWLYVKGVTVAAPPGATLANQGRLPSPRPEPTLTPSPSPCAQGEGCVDGEVRSRTESLLASTLPSPSALGEGLGVRDSPAEQTTVIEPSLAVNGNLFLAGSIVAALAFLTRQQGALIVPAVVMVLLLSGRLRWNRASLALILQVTVPMALTIGGYFLWLRYGNDVPQVQASFFREVLEEGWSGTWWLLRRLTVVELMYLGFFTLPLMAAVLPFLRSLVTSMPRRGWLLFALWMSVVSVGVAILWRDGARMPYIAQFFGAGGLGPPDILGSRPRILTAEMRGGLTAFCLVASLLLALVAARGVGAPPSLERSRAGMVLGIGLWQVIGVLPPSYHYIGWAAGSLDRYLLPLAPLVIALALWALREVRLALPLGWLLAIALALFSVAGTRDYLVFMREVWAMGDRALAAGVPLDRLDAGSGWDGYYLYEYGLENRSRSRTPKGGPWWVYFYAPATDSAYAVAGKPRKDYVVVEERPYDSWLDRGDPTLVLLRRSGEPWPPMAAAQPIKTRPAPGGLQTIIDEKEGPETGSERDDA